MEECNHMDKPLRDLMEIIHFTENVSAKIHGLLDEAEIYRTVREEFAKSKRYSASIMLLTDDGSKLRIAETSLSPEELRAGEQASGLRIEGYRIDLNKSSIYSQVIREGKSVQVSVSDTIGELLPRALAHVISKIMGYEGKKSVLTPLRRHGEIIGAFAMTSTDLVEHFIPSVRNLAHHISTALEMAEENGQRVRAEQALQRAHHRLERRVEERTARLTAANEQLNREITERKQVEEALREANARLNMLIEAIPDLIYFKDVQGRHLVVNKAVEELTGLEKEEILGQTDDRLLPLDLAEQCRRSDQAAIEGRKVVRVEEHTTDDKGERVFFDTIKSPLLDDQGNVRGLVGVSRDITDRRRMEEALRESEEKYRHVVERANDGIVIIQDRLVRYVNPRLAEMWGGTAEELIGTPFTDHIWPDELPKVVDRYERRMAGQDVPRIYETALRRKDSSKVYAELNAGIITYQGEPADLVIIRDITERKRAEEEIRQRNQELAALNAVAATVSSSLDLEEILDRALDKVLEVAGVEVGSIHLWDDRAEELVLATYRGVPQEFADQVRTFRVGERLAGRVAQSGEPIVVDDVTEDPRLTTTLVRGAGIRSLSVIPMKSRQKVQGVMHIASRKYHPFEPDEVRLYTAIANQIGVAIHNAQLWEATKRRLQESTILLEVSRALAAVLELGELLQMIIDSAVETIETAESGVIHLLDDATGELHPKALAGERPRATGKARMRIGKGIAGYALQQGEVINVSDVDGDPRFIGLEGDHELKSLLVAPLLAEGRRIGTISIKSKQVGAFTPEDERLSMTLGAHAAAAVKNAQLFAQSEELAIAKERNRIAREVHDGLAQNLASLLIKIDLCRGLIDSDPQETKALLEEVKRAIRESIQEIRRSIFALQLPDLEESGFLPALRKYAEGLQEENELPVHLSIVGEEAQSQLPSSYEYALFRIIQEASRNVIKHAKAKNVWIILDLSAPHVVSLTVRDDGLGFDRKMEGTATAVWVGGFGLAGMRERTKALGGELIVEAELGSGTKITATLPLRRRE